MMLKFLSCILFFILPSYGHSRQFDFNALPIPISDEIEIDRVISGGIKPGKYDLTIDINGTSVAEMPIYLFDKFGRITPCIDSNILHAIGVKVHDNLIYDEGNCLESNPAMIEFHYDNSQMKVQVKAARYLLVSEHDRTMQLLDSGINAYRVNYDIYTQTSKGEWGNRINSNAAYLSNMLNIGQWRAKSRSQLTMTEERDVIDTPEWYIYRPIIERESVLYFGKKSSSQSLFDSRYFVGAEYMTEQRLQDSEKYNHAPPISVFLSESALVTLYQNDLVIFQDYFMPGLHNIEEYVVISDQDILIEIKEDSGSIKKIISPFSKNHSSFKAGESYFYFSAGEEQGHESNNHFTQGLYKYGFSDYLTLLFGGDLTSSYISQGIGADVSFSEHSYLTIKGINLKKERYIDLAAVQSLSDNTEVTFTHRQNYSNYESISSMGHKSTSSINMNVHFDIYEHPASTFLSLTNYTSSGATNEVQGSINLHWNLYRFNINASYVKYIKENTPNNTRNDFFGIRLSVPLDVFGLDSRGSVSRTFSSNGGETSVQNYINYEKLTLSGVLSKADHSPQPSFASSATYHSGITEIHTNAYLSEYGNNFMTRLKGAGIFSDKGIVFSEKAPETMMLAHTPNVKNIQYKQEPYISSDNDGLSVVDISQPYQSIDISIDETTIPNDADLQTLSTNVVATQGAVIYKKINVNSGTPLLIMVKNHDLIKMPFGATVSVPGYNIPLLSESGGEIFIPAFPYDTHSVNVSWSSGECSIHIDEEKIIHSQDINIYEANCK